MERLFYKFGDDIDDKVLRHLKRYSFCSKRINAPSKTLDYGCGSGYGAKTISSKNEKNVVIGYDPSQEAIDFATKNNATPNILFTTKLDDIQTNHDQVLLIDMIEHLSDQEIDNIIPKLTRENPNATFYISTPLSDFDGQSPTNPYHINAFQKERFINTLNKYFKTHELWHLDWSYSRLMNEKETGGKVMAICKN